MLIGSLFSGIGGLDLGVSAAGLGSVAYHVELEPFQRNVLGVRWPLAKSHLDVRMPASSLPHTDVIVGGFPCTGFSKAGAGEGLRNPASALWFDMLRIITERRPNVVVIENVMSILQPRFSHDMAEIYSGLRSTGLVVDAPFCVSSAEVGAPHRRERAFILAIRPGFRAKLDVVGPMVGNYPAPRNMPARAGEPPRTLTKRLRVLHKRDRLKALGNAVVPDVGRLAGLHLRQRLGGSSATPGPRMIPKAFVTPSGYAAPAMYWPTPVFRDSNGTRRETARKDHWKSNPGTTLTDAVWLNDPADYDRPLNPDWVEALMGFPAGWTRV